MKTLIGYAVLWSIASPGCVSGKDPTAPARFKEYFLRGSCRKLLDTQSEITCYIDHNVQLPIAKRSTGAMRVREDDLGLYVEVDLDPRYERIATHAVGWSVSFIADHRLDIYNPGCTVPRRYVGEVTRLDEVSLIVDGSRPAHRTTIACIERDDRAAIKIRVVAHVAFARLAVR